MYGTYRHTLDAKGRIFVPAKMREELGDSFFVTVSAQNCLTAYTDEGWSELERRARALPKKDFYAIRPLFAQAERCEADSQGRILLPARLREHAGLKKNVTIVGMLDEAQFWDSEQYDELEAREASPENIADIFERLSL